MKEKMVIILVCYKIRKAIVDICHIPVICQNMM